MVFINGCEQADVAIPYIPSATRVVYVVHDTARRYWQSALDLEENLDAIVAISNTVADQFRSQLQWPDKLHIAHNGTLFLDYKNTLLQTERPVDLIFLGGDKPIKGAYDVLRLWPHLSEKGFLGQLHWFGEVSAKFRAEVEALPRATDIILHGRVVRSKIFRQAAAARVLLMLSRVEPFGGYD